MKVVVDRLAWIPKADLSVPQIQALHDQLLVTPRKVGDHPGDPPSPIQLWEETDTHLGVPRSYYLERRKEEHQIEFRYGKQTPFARPPAFVGELRPDQKNAQRVVLRDFEDDHCAGGIVRAAPGWGKTVFACSLMSKLAVPTLVVVHKEFLMSQWKERIEQFLPAASVGLIQQDVCDFEGKHVVLAMVHSLSQKAYPKELYSYFGFVVTDEVHRIGAETWSPVPARFDARWRLGISATPRRKDGADNVFKYHIGRVLYGSEEMRLPVKVKRVWSTFKLVKTPTFNPNLAPKTLILRFLVASQQRNELVAKQIVAAAKAGRKILVLSERLQHLDDMDTVFRALWREEEENSTSVPTVGFYVGGIDDADREEAAKAQVIFATSQYVSEGLDIPAIDTLVLATPMYDVEQAVGRIQRPLEGKKDPIVVDIRDDGIRIFRAAGEARDRFYPRVT